MNKLMLLMCTILIAFQSHSGSGIYEDAVKEGVSSKCLTHLKALSAFLNADGLNQTVTHPNNPSNSQSYHSAISKNTDGSSSYTIILIPTGDRCSWSYSKTTNFDETSCVNLKKQFEDKLPNLKIQVEQNGYTSMLNPDNGLNIMMVERGDQSCTSITSQSQFLD